MKIRFLRYGSEWMRIREDGAIARPAIGMGFSDSWRVTGAVVRNNFGHATEHYTLADLMERGDALQWRHKNGKQRIFIRDIDHGTPREWYSPTHWVGGLTV